MVAERCVAQSTDRRYSARWRLDRAFAWRAYRGRRVRQARVVERSLNGLVIETDHERLLRIGQMIRPADDWAGLRHGYRLAIVRRVQPLDRRRDRVMFEILA